MGWGGGGGGGGLKNFEECGSGFDLIKLPYLPQVFGETGLSKQYRS